MGAVPDGTGMDKDVDVTQEDHIESRRRKRPFSATVYSNRNRSLRYSNPDQTFRNVDVASHRDSR